MRKLSVFLCVAALSIACSPRHAGSVTWTIDGEEAASACGDLADGINIKVFPSAGVNAEMQEPVEETSADCAAGTADVSLGNYSTVFIEAKKGDQVVGLGGPANVQAQGGLVGSINPLNGAILVDMDVAITVGFLDVAFQVAQDTCEAAGLGEVEVMLYKNLVSLDREPVWDDPMTADCAEGLTIQGVEVGSSYSIEVSGSANGSTFGTAGSGHRVSIQAAGSATQINLIDISSPTD